MTQDGEVIQPIQRDLKGLHLMKFKVKGKAIGRKSPLHQDRLGLPGWRQPVGKDFGGPEAEHEPTVTLAETSQQVT